MVFDVLQLLNVATAGAGAGAGQGAGGALGTLLTDQYTLSVDVQLYAFVTLLPLPVNNVVVYATWLKAGGVKALTTSGVTVGGLAVFSGTVSKDTWDPIIAVDIEVEVPGWQPASINVETTETDTTLVGTALTIHDKTNSVAKIYLEIQPGG